MKSLFGKRWHRIPVVMVSVLLAVVLIAGGAIAAYDFWSATAKVDVVEAIAIGAGTWDNLAPYGSVDDVDIAIGEDGDGNPVLTITTAAETPYVGEGFCPAESIVIPLNIRNGSDGELTLKAVVTENTGDFVLEASYELNKGDKTDEIPAGHEGEYLAYGFEAQGEFTKLHGWSETVAGNSGFSGSAVHDAQVLFVRISVPGDTPPTEEEGAPLSDPYSLSITFSRS